MQVSAFGVRYAPLALFVIGLVWLGLAILVYFRAKQQGRSGIRWFCIGLLLGPVAALMITALPPPDAPMTKPKKRRGR